MIESDIELIHKFLSIDQPMEQNPIRFSTLALLIKGGRELSGRDKISGKYEGNELFKEEHYINQTFHSHQLIGLISYLILLEQIGSIFAPQISGANIDKNPIIRTLTIFSNISEFKKSAIKALRNSLTHKFGLATEKGKPDKFKFSLDFSNRNSDFIQPVQWDGNFCNKSDSTSTNVFVIDFIDFIEKIYQRVVHDWQQGELKMVICKEELKARFTIIYDK